jgi:hypothetical protein
MTMRVLRPCIIGAAAVLLAACGAATPAAPSPTSASSASTTAPPVKTTVVKTTSQKDVLAGLCARHCTALDGIYDLAPCVDGPSCQADVSRADASIAALRTDMAENDIDREDFLDLDDALDNAQDAIDGYNMFDCIDAPAGSADMFSCSINVLTIKTNVGTVSITLGGAPYK